MSGARMPASCHGCRHPLPSFRRKPEPTFASPVPACPRVATDAATPSRLSGESRNPRRLTVSYMPASCHGCRHPLPSFRRKPEPTSPLRCPNARELPRMPPPPPVFPVKAGTHVASPVPTCPRVGHGCRRPPCPTPSRLHYRGRKPEPTSPPGVRMPASWRKGTLDVGVTSNLSK